MGSTVAKQTGLEVGETFVGTHGYIELPEGTGHVHSDFVYEVVGILKPSGTPNDRAIFCTLDSVWDVHGLKHGAGYDSQHGGHGDAHAAEVHEHEHAEHARTDTNTMPTVKARSTKGNTNMPAADEPRP